MKIPFNKPYLSGNEKKYIEDVLARKELSGDGHYTQKVSDFLEKEFNFSKVLMTTSGTHALEMAAELINLGEGDEVIMPSFTFTSTANAVLMKGAKPVFAEIKENTFNLDPSYLEKYVNNNTKAIIPVHYAGVGCEMDEILNFSDKYGLYVIEDAAHALNAKYKNNYLGGMGDFGCFSFHSSKNYISGEGGALVINNKNKNIVDRAEIIREKGTNRKSFLKGEVDKYTWVDKGSSYLPSDLLMALLYGQLENLEKIKDLRENIHNFYYKKLQKYLSKNFIDYISSIPENRDSNFHIFYLKFNNNIRDMVLKKLNNRGIDATFHYIPLHSSPMGKRLGYKKNDLRITNEVSKSLLRLPIYPDLKQKELKYIIENLNDIFNDIQSDKG